MTGLLACSGLRRKPPAACISRDAFLARPPAPASASGGLPPRLKAALTKASADPSYAALGLLPSIPLPEGANARVKLPTQALPEDAPVVGFGRIVRDAEGNVIDIIIDGEEEETQEKEEESRWGKPLNPEEDAFEKAPVQAKTQVVRGEYRRARLSSSTTENG